MKRFFLFFLLIASWHISVSFRKHEVKKDIKVIYFLSPTCTICQFYTLKMREFYQVYSGQGISFSAVFSSRLCDGKVIEDFKMKYEIPFDIACDTTLHERVNATVTPEVFVMDESGIVLYSGRIDDSYAAIGKRKTRARHNELKDALDQLLKGDSVKVDHMPAVGCIIQK